MAELVLTTPETLSVTNVIGGAVVTGGVDGKALVATFASRNAADHFVRYCVEKAKTFEGWRR